MVYERNPAAHYRSANGVITIVKQNDHPIQKFFRKLHFKIPMESTLTLDQYGSFIFSHLDGKTNVYQLGQMLGEKYQETKKYQYTRLIIFLRKLDQENNLINQVK